MRRSAAAAARELTELTDQRPAPRDVLRLRLAGGAARVRVLNYYPPARTALATRLYPAHLLRGVADL